MGSPLPSARFLCILVSDPSQLLTDLGAMNTIAEGNKILESLGGSVEEPVTTTQDPSNHYSPGVTSSTEEKALDLLGSGVQAEQVASALGVTAARITQLMANEEFAAKVVQRRYLSLRKHNERDNNYDSLEDKLLVKLEKSLPFMMKPETILKAIAVVNGAKRRGQSSPDQVINQQNVVNLILPEVITRKFTTDVNNQVIQAGDQDLLTIQSGELVKQIEQAAEARTLDYTESTEIVKNSEDTNDQETRS